MAEGRAIYGEGLMVDLGRGGARNDRFRVFKNIEHLVSTANTILDLELLSVVGVSRSRLAIRRIDIALRRVVIALRVICVRTPSITRRSRLPCRDCSDVDRSTSHVPGVSLVNGRCDVPQGVDEPRRHGNVRTAGRARR